MADVLSFQRDLATAQANEVRAIADYYEALTNLESVRGTVLETNTFDASGNFVFTNGLSPDLQQRFYILLLP